MFEIRREKEEEEEGWDDREECFLVYFVYDNSWDEEFKIDFSHHYSSTCGCGQFQENGYPCVHTLFVLHQKNMLDDVLKSSIDEGYLRKKVAKTCLSLSVGWMNKLQGVEGVDKSELVEESQKEEYTLCVYMICGRRHPLYLIVFTLVENRIQTSFLEERSERRQIMLNLN